LIYIPAALKATEYYKKSIRLNPNNENGEKKIKKMKEKKN